MYTPLKVQKHVSSTAETYGWCHVFSLYMDKCTADTVRYLQLPLNRDKPEQSKYATPFYQSLSFCVGYLPTFQNFARVKYLVVLLLFRVWAQALPVII
jgi:hypothetical protein